MQARVPLYGCDCYAYGLLAAGFCDLVVEADMKPYDYMALVPVVQGAGGAITNWKVGFTPWLTNTPGPCLLQHRPPKAHRLLASRSDLRWVVGVRVCRARCCGGG